MRIRFTTTRPPARLLDLQLAGTLLRNDGLYLQIAANLRNLGSAPQPLQQEGSRCQIVAVKRDLSEQPVRIFPVFLLRESIGPHESLGDLKLAKLPLAPEEMVWVRINLRVVSSGIEWNASCVLPVENTVQQPEMKAANLLAVAHGPIPERRELTLQIERQKKEQTEQDRRLPQPIRPRREVVVAPRAAATRTAEAPAILTEAE